VLNANPRINAPFKDTFVCCLFEGHPNSPLGRKKEIDISKKPMEKKDLSSVASMHEGITWALTYYIHTIWKRNIMLLY
jgi:hypothetical protein